MPIIPPQHMPITPFAFAILLHLPLPFESVSFNPNISILVLCLLLLHQFCTTHCSHHCPLGPSQYCHLIFPQTLCFTPILWYNIANLKTTSINHSFHLQWEAFWVQQLSAFPHAGNTTKLKVLPVFFIFRPNILLDHLFFWALTGICTYKALAQ